MFKQAILKPRSLRNQCLTIRRKYIRNGREKRGLKETLQDPSKLLVIGLYEKQDPMIQFIIMSIILWAWGERILNGCVFDGFMGVLCNQRVNFFSWAVVYNFSAI